MRRARLDKRPSPDVGPELAHQRNECRKAGRDHVCAIHRNRPIRNQSKHEKAHCNAMVVMRCDRCFPFRRRSGAVNDKALLAFFDLYAAGTVFYYLLTGRVPFPARSLIQSHGVACGRP